MIKRGGHARSAPFRNYVLNTSGSIKVVTSLGMGTLGDLRANSLSLSLFQFTGPCRESDKFRCGITEVCGAMCYPPEVSACGCTLKVSC